MSYNAPPIVKLTERIVVEIEGAVRQFPRYHKYSVGTELRAQAREVMRCAHRAWRDQRRRGKWLSELVFAVDDLKLNLQISKRVAAFKSFAQFESLCRLLADLGRQCGGWQKQHLKGQNRQTEPSPGRAQILSARNASDGAHP